MVRDKEIMERYKQSMEEGPWTASGGPNTSIATPVTLTALTLYGPNSFFSLFFGR